MISLSLIDMPRDLNPVKAGASTSVSVCTNTPDTASTNLVGTPLADRSAITPPTVLVTSPALVPYASSTVGRLLPLGLSLVPILSVSFLSKTRSMSS